jgi:triosephosphate isomerase (TIM)
MSQKIVIANWKMNPTKPADAKKTYSAIQKGAAKIKGVNMYVCPPAIFLPELAKLKSVRNVQLGVQDLSHEESGAYTGQTSSSMVKGYKAKLAILGHSERRAIGETNAVVGQKVLHAIKAGFQVVLCVGESARSEEGDYYTFIREEIETALSGVKKADISKLTIAYEPIWAIGKQAEEALDAPALYEMVLFIRKVLIEKYGRAPAENIPILYGGSVKPENTKEFLVVGQVDGLLVGSASLNPKQFLDITTITSSV